ncbi:hypothetical protein C5167_001746 [Papaver somniferum]|uniref:Uncharacterized protein n=1 Tax=Papaver somniferum TaxID=3469 RepID=A0A4Y7L048_PAPSO|nr:hypothetical protein C5167_001746 [Papaver somniferum]
MAQNLAALREELSMFLSTKYDEGLLDRDDFECFRGVQNMEDHKKKGFSMASDLLTVIYKDGEQMIGEIYQLYAKPVINIVKIGDLIHRIHSNSKGAFLTLIVALTVVMLERRIHNLIISQPPTIVLSRASPPAISLSRALTSGIPRVPPPSIDGRRRSPLPPQTNDRRRV